MATCSLQTPTDKLKENYSIRIDIANSRVVFYAQSVSKTVIRPVLIWKRDLGKAEQNLLERTEMRMLRWMMGIKRIEKIGNEEIRARADVANVSEKIREARPRWLGHVEKKTDEDVVHVRRTWKWVDTER